MRMFLLTCGTAIAALSATLVVAVAAIGAPAAEVDGVWVDGTIHRFSATVPATPGKPPTPLYAMAPVHPSDPLHPLVSARTKGFGAHDHVVADPTPNASFKTVCKVTLTLPGARAKVGTNVLIRQTDDPTRTTAASLRGEPRHGNEAAHLCGPNRTSTPTRPGEVRRHTGGVQLHHPTSRLTPSAGSATVARCPQRATGGRPGGGPWAPG